MALSNEEEMIHREAIALAGDLQQFADNMLRDHNRRIEERKNNEEISAHNRNRSAGDPMLPYSAMMPMDMVAIERDLRFIGDRLNLLKIYIEGFNKRGG